MKKYLLNKVNNGKENLRSCLNLLTIRLAPPAFIFVFFVKYFVFFVVQKTAGTQRKIQYKVHKVFTC